MNQGSHYSSAEEDIGEDDLEEEFVREPDEYETFLNEEITECFSIFDKTETGAFDAKYLGKCLYCLGINLNSLEMEELKADVVLDDMVQFDPFRTFAIQQLMDLEEIDHLRAALKVFDPDNEGIIPSDRFKRWMMKLGNPLTEKEAKELIKLGDPSNKGTVSYDNLTIFLLSKK